MAKKISKQVEKMISALTDRQKRAIKERMNIDIEEDNDIETIREKIKEREEEFYKALNEMRNKTR